MLLAQFRRLDPDAGSRGGSSDLVVAWNGSTHPMPGSERLSFDPARSRYEFAFVRRATHTMLGLMRRARHRGNP